MTRIKMDKLRLPKMVDLHIPSGMLGISITSLTGKEHYRTIRVNIEKYVNNNFHISRLLRIVDDVDETVILGYARSMQLLNHVVTYLRIKLLSSDVRIVEKVAVLIDALVKNCKYRVHFHVGNRTFMKTIGVVARQLYFDERIQYRRVGFRILDILQGWGEAFSQGERILIYPHIVETYQKMQYKYGVSYQRPHFDPSRVPIFLGPIHKYEIMEAQGKRNEITLDIELSRRMQTRAKCDIEMDDFNQGSLSKDMVSDSDAEVDNGGESESSSTVSNDDTAVWRIYKEGALEIESNNAALSSLLCDVDEYATNFTHSEVYVTSPVAIVGCMESPNRKVEGPFEADCGLIEMTDASRTVSSSTFDCDNDIDNNTSNNIDNNTGNNIGNNIHNYTDIPHNKNNIEIEVENEVDDIMNMKSKNRIKSVNFEESKDGFGKKSVSSGTRFDSSVERGINSSAKYFDHTYSASSLECSDEIHSNILTYENSVGTKLDGNNISDLEINNIDALYSESAPNSVYKQEKKNSLNSISKEYSSCLSPFAESSYTKPSSDPTVEIKYFGHQRILVRKSTRQINTFVGVNKL